MEAEITPEPQSKIVLFLNHYKFKIEPDAVLPCEPRRTKGRLLSLVYRRLPRQQPPKLHLRSTQGQEESPDAGPMMATMAAASVLNKSVANKSVLNKASLNKNKDKNKNKNKNKSTMDGASLGVSQLIPALRIAAAAPATVTQRLYRSATFAWEMLDILPPPGPDYTRLETTVLLSMQRRDRERVRRLPDIQLESTISVSEFTRAL